MRRERRGDPGIHERQEPRGCVHEPDVVERALVFDAHYDSYKGVVAYVRVFEGKIKSLSKDEASVFVPGLNTEVIGMPISAGLVKGEEVVVSIRPEKIRIAEKDTKSNTMFRARVTNTVYIGADTHIYVDVHDTKVKVLEQNRISRLDPKSFYVVGQDVWLMLMPENTLVLKKD